MVPTIDLNNGLKMPILGLGTFLSPPGEVEQAVKDAVDAGYRHFDTAYVYQNETEVGRGLKAKIDEGVVKREDLFVVTKLWNTHHNPLIVISALKMQLELLGLDYIDCYLLHWPIGYADTGELMPKGEDGEFIFSNYDYVGAYKEMEKCVELGLTKSIGVSNFNSEQLTRLLAATKIVPVTNQVESHPYLSQDKLYAFCKSKGVTLTAYAPLGAPGRPWAKADDPSLLEEPNMKAIAEKHKKTVAQVLLKYQIQKGLIVIPKSVTKSRIQENINVFDFELSDEDIATIASFNRGNEGRFFVEVGKKSAYFPFNAEF